ncbi:MAG: Hpt domain-containing protein [Pseudomonadota bacterium]
MQSNALNSTATDLDLAVNDLGPLAWVLDELRKSLDGAAKALKRFVRDAEAARGSDLAAIDASQLRIARQQLHQAVGALEMVGLAGPALVLRAMEAAVQKFIQQPEQCNQDAAAKIERASFALTEYLEAVLADKPISAVSLFPQYREVQELVRADRIHPADLWPHEWRWIEPDLLKSAAPVAYNDAGRSVLDQSVLQIMKGDGVRAGESLLALCLGFAANQTDRQPRIFWKIAAAYFEALAHGLLGSDIYIRRAASRILLQYASLSKGNHGISERLAHDLLFFCSQAVAARATDTPVLSAVRAAYGLARFKPVDYEAVQFGRFDPALLAQARKRIVSAKETWSSLSAGDANKFKQVVDQFSLVSDSLVKLHPPSEPLAQALTRAIDMTARSGHAPGIELAMEVATSVLYLEAAFEDLDPRDPQLAERTRHLAERLESVRAGGQPQPLESWMEELYRRVSDKQTMGSVVGELRISLGELEKSLDLFFRNPQDKAVLRNVPGQLSQMRGVLSVLGLEQASQAVLRMRDSVEQMLVTEVDEQRARAAGTFDQLGNNLGALSFLIDMLNYQPVLAKKLFVYDNEKGELKPLMGRSHKHDDPATSVTVPGETLSQEVISVVQEADSGASEEKLTDKLDTLATHAALAGQSALAQTAHKASIAVSGHNQEATATALTSLVSSVAPIPAPPAVVEADNFEEDDLRDIFLEEAREVAGNGQEALRILAKEPGDIGQLTVLRRVFHTLKGSSRMVGLNEFGEAAWSLEQMLNGWLAEQKPSTEELRTLCAETLGGFSLWIEDIASNKDGVWLASSFRLCADAMRVEGRYVPLKLPSSKLPEPVAAPAVVELPQAIVPVAEPALTAFAAFEAFEALEALGVANTAAAPAVVLEVVPAEMPVAELEVIASPVAQASDTVEPVKAVELLQIAPLVEPVPVEPAPVVEAPAAAVEEEILDFDVMFDMTPPVEPKALDVVAPAADIPQAAVKTGIAEEIQGIDFDSLAILSASHEVESVEAVSSALTAEVPVVLVIEAPVLPAEPEAAASVDVLELSAADFDAQFLAEADSAPALSLPSVSETGSPAVMDLAGTADQAETAEAAPAEAVELVFDDVGSLALKAPVVEVLAITPEPPVAPVAKPEPLVLPVADVSLQTEEELDAAFASDDGADEQVKVIGSLRIGIPLYNVYLNEADEWSRRLVTEVSEWTIERHHPINDSTVALAHSLAGSSATVGFEALSEIARALEHALQQAQAHHSSAAVVDYSGLFVDAAEDIRRLLHQFAAGFLKTPDASLLERLRNLEFAESASILPTDEDEFDFSTPEAETSDADLAIIRAMEAEAQQVFEEKQAPSVDLSVTQLISLPSFASAPAVAEPAKAVEPATPVLAATPVVVEPEAAPLPSAELPRALVDTALAVTPEPVLELPEVADFVQPTYQVPVLPVSLAATAAEALADDEDDEIDAVDAIDPELFPIFDEEASELMPQLGGALRQWSSRPGDLGARMEVLRVLHTLKGSARLAGALRLGEMAHRIESEIEFMGSDSAESQDFDPLLTRFDAMQLTLEVLRRADQPGAETSQGVPEVIPVAAPASVKPVMTADMQSPVAVPAVDAPAVPAAAQATTGTVPATVPAGGKIMIPAPQAMAMQPLRQAASASIRVKSQLLDRMVNQAGEVMITRSRLEVELNQLRGSLSDMNGNLNRLRQQLRDIEVQAESQMQSRLAQAKEAQAGFDPLEFDRFTRVQELTRMMAESVNDVATVQRTLQRTVEATEDDLIAQARQTRELQRDLLRTRMVEFEGISDRLYRVVRQASKETGKQVRLDLLGGTIEMDRGMLDRMTPAFEHLLRNCVAHGIESPEVRIAAGKDPVGLITVNLRQEGNDVSVDFSDDGAGLNLVRIREKAVSLGMVSADQAVTDSEAANLIFLPGFSTASQVTELAGRGIGMDVVRSEVNGVGGRIETSTVTGGGTHFKLVLPLTTAVTQVVMLRAGNLSVGVPATVVETVRRATAKELQQAYNIGTLDVAGEAVPFFWSGALLQASHRSADAQGKTTPVVIFRSAAQRIALHVDEVLGNQEVVVKNLGPQLSRLPGLAGMSVLASGAVVLIYNPVALASIYGEQARAWSRDSAEPHMLEGAAPTASTSGEVPRAFVPVPVAPKIPLIMVVDDSITVRRVTQRLLQREGYRVVMAADGLQALERLQEELPVVVLSDIEMPRMDGFDLARNIRADARLRKLPIVMITSRIAEKHRDHAKELGVDHYLGKPYAEEELMSLVRHYCNVEVAA